MPGAVKAIANEIGANKYTICGNGTLIYDLQKEKIIYDSFMEKQKVLDIIKICEENSIYYNIYAENEVIAKSLNYNILFYDRENSKKPIEKRTNINIVQDVYKYIQQKDDINILKMTICDNSKIIFGGIVKTIKTIPKIDVLEIEHMSRKIIKDGTELSSDYITDLMAKTEEILDVSNAIVVHDLIKEEGNKVKTIKETNGGE